MRRLQCGSLYGTVWHRMEYTGTRCIWRPSTLAAGDSLALGEIRSSPYESFNTLASIYNSTVCWVPSPRCVINRAVDFEWSLEFECPLARLRLFGLNLSASSSSASSSSATSPSDSSSSASSFSKLFFSDLQFFFSKLFFRPLLRFERPFRTNN